MAERFWEHNTPRRHIYICGDTGRILGSLYQRLSDRAFEAVAYDQQLGDFARAERGRTAVEAACTGIEAERARERERQNAKAAAQADGVQV